MNNRKAHVVLPLDWKRAVGCGVMLLRMCIYRRFEVRYCVCECGLWTVHVSEVRKEIKFCYNEDLVLGRPRSFGKWLCVFVDVKTKKVFIKN